MYREKLFARNRLTLTPSRFRGCTSVRNATSNRDRFDVDIIAQKKKKKILPRFLLSRSVSRHPAVRTHAYVHKHYIAQLRRKFNSRDDFLNRLWNGTRDVKNNKSILHKNQSPISSLNRPDVASTLNWRCISDLDSRVSSVTSDRAATSSSLAVFYAPRVLFAFLSQWSGGFSLTPTRNPLLSHGTEDDQSTGASVHTSLSHALFSRLSLSTAISSTRPRYSSRATLFLPIIRCESRSKRRLAYLVGRSRSAEKKKKRERRKHFFSLLISFFLFLTRAQL